MEQSPRQGRSPRLPSSGWACCPVWSLPRGLALGPSLSAERGLGVWCVGRELQPGTLPMLLGPREEEEEEQQQRQQEVFPSACWKEASTCDKISSWSSLVKQSRDEDEANVAFVWIDGELHIRVCDPIAAGSELLYWLTESQVSPDLEKSTPARMSNEVTVAERDEQHESLAVATPSEASGATNVPRAVDQKARDSCVPALDKKLSTKQLLRVENDCKKRHVSKALQCEQKEAKARNEDSQLLASNSAAEVAAVPRPQAERGKEALTDAELTEAHRPPPPSHAICLSARLAGQLRKMQALRDQACAEAVSGRCATLQPMENGEENLRQEEPHNSKGGAPPFKEASNERRHLCQECGKTFLQLCHLKKHHFVHTDHKPFLCTECGKSYSSEESFKAHMLGHRGVRPFPCPQCHKTYGTKRDLQEHQVLHTGQRPFVCPECGKSFARRPSLRIHRKTHQAKELSPSTTSACQCLICGRHLANPGSLRNHMRLHTGERPYTCSFCPKSFRQQGNLRGHLRLHTGERPYRCHFCGDAFPQRPELRRHLISHTGEAHLCTVCGKALRDPHTLRAHERLHTGERPFHCHLCPKSYPLATKLRRHLKAHHGDKPHRCMVCGISYALPQSLRRHQLEHKRNLDKDFTKPALRDPQVLPASEQPAVLAPGNKAEPLLVLLLTRNEHYIAAQEGSARHQEGLEIAFSDAEEECILVQEQGSPSDMLIIQEAGVGFSTVAEVVEVEVGT